MADERDNELPRALRTSDLSRVKALPFKHRPIVARARPIPGPVLRITDRVPHPHSTSR